MLDSSNVLPELKAMFPAHGLVELSRPPRSPFLTGGRMGLTRSCIGWGSGSLGSLGRFGPGGAGRTGLGLMIIRFGACTILITGYRGLTIVGLMGMG